jgi:transposase InsO family protein
MEAVYYAARANLRRLMILHPSWTRGQLAQATGMSKSWVDKWKKRLLSVPFDDEQVLCGLSRAPHHPPPQLDSQVIDRLLEIRDDPPEGLGRTPGPKAILYYLNRDETMKERKLRLPKSTRTVYRLLRENGRIASRLPTVTEPLERPAPMQGLPTRLQRCLQRTRHDPHGKKQHVVETLNIIDKGTSVLVAHHVRADFTAETALVAVAQTFAEQGLPTSITLDRDTRWVGAPQGSDAPFALVRFCQSLGVTVLLCDPHHPQQNGFVERYHRTLTEECLRLHRPKALDEVRQVTEAFATHYNWQRPHQGISCGNRPPRVAFPTLPSLPRVPDLVNPDAWLSRVKGQHLVRRVNRQGEVSVDLYPYYISSKLAGQKVTLSIQATEQSMQVVYPQEYRRSLPLKGLQQRALPYQEYLELMQREASTQQRLLAIGRWKGRSD